MVALGRGGQKPRREQRPYHAVVERSGPHDQTSVYSPNAHGGTKLGPRVAACVARALVRHHRLPAATGGGPSKASQTPAKDSKRGAHAAGGGERPDPHATRGSAHAATKTTGGGGTAEGAPSPSWTLHEAGLCGSAAAFTALLAAGADVHAPGADG